MDVRRQVGPQLLFIIHLFLDSNLHISVQEVRSNMSQKMIPVGAYTGTHSLPDIISIPRENSVVQARDINVEHRLSSHDGFKTLHE